MYYRSGDIKSFDDGYVHDMSRIFSSFVTAIVALLLSFVTALVAHASLLVTTLVAHFELHNRIALYTDRHESRGV